MSIPKHAMCMVCGDVIYAGPGINPIPRECQCKATIVIPMEDRGYVRWDPKAYEAGAKAQAEKTRDRILREAAVAAKEKYSSLGFSEEEVLSAVKDAMEEAKPQANQAYELELANAPKEPDIEYTEEFLDPHATRVMVPELELDKVVQHHMDKLARGEDP